MSGENSGPDALDVFTRLSPLAPFPPLGDFASIKPGPVAVIAPHPDDEIIGCGGALALHRKRGDEVRVIFVTDGAGGDRDDVTRGRVRQVRQEESRRAGAEIGVEDFVCCDLPDGQVRPDEATVQVIAAQLNQKPFETVYAPSPFECHPDHLACGLATAKAMEGLSNEAQLLLYEINQQQLPSFLFDITEVATEKRRALACFTSQIRYIDIVSKAMGGSYARTVNIDLPEVRFAEAYRAVEPSQYLILAESVLRSRS